MNVVVKSSGCYYGVHFGCLCTALDPSCCKCAERLTNAVNYVLHTGVNDTKALRRAAAPYAGSAAEAHAVDIESIHFAEAHDVWRDSELPHE